MVTLTIVVPSYNTAEYIDECLPTMLDPRILDRIEILLIDDGSTDGITPQKADGWAARCPGTIRAIHKENGGHGSVINMGIDEARGRWYKVIDGDDWVLTDGLVRLVDALETADADLVLCPYVRHHVGRGTDTLFGLHISRYGETLDLGAEGPGPRPIAIQSITWRTGLLREHGIRVREGCFYEDQEYDIYPLPYARTVIGLDFPVYVYRIGTPGQSTATANVIRDQDMLLKIEEDLTAFYEGLDGIDPGVAACIRAKILELIDNVYGTYLRLPFSREAREGIREHDRRLSERSPDLYAAGARGGIRLLRSHTWAAYAAAYLAFKAKRMMRGF